MSGKMGRYKTYAVLTLVALIWAGTFIVTNLIVQEIPPIVGAFIRFFISGTVLLAVLFLSQKERMSLRRDDLVRLFILGFSGIFLYNYFFFYGLKITTAVNGSLIIAANPATTTLLSALLGVPITTNMLFNGRKRSQQKPCSARN